MEESVEKCQQALVSPKTCIFFKNLRLLAKFVKTFFLNNDKYREKNIGKV